MQCMCSDQKKNRLHALLFSEVRGDTRRYRSLHLVEQIFALGLNCDFVHMADWALFEKVLQDTDIVIFHRVAFGDHVKRLLDYFRSRNSLILFDFDDLIFDVDAFQFINSPDFADPIRVEMYLQTMRNISAMLEHSEGVLVSTNFLSDRIASLGKPVWVHRNAFSLEMLTCSESARVKKPDNVGKVVIGYASGTSTHNRDFELVKPALQSIMRRDPRVVLRLVGPLDPGVGWEGLESRIERQKLVPWRKLPGILAGFDINLAPLVMDNPFAQSKSEIKYMEAAMVETPTIASATDAFRYAICGGETGLLVDSPDGWQSAIEHLVQDANLRVELGQRAYQAVIKEYHPVTRATQLAKTLDEISEKLRGQPFWQGNGPDEGSILARTQSMSQSKRWLPRRYEKDPSNFELGLYSLRHRGWKTFLRQVWIFFRRLVAPVFPFKQG